MAATDAASGNTAPGAQGALSKGPRKYALTLLLVIYIFNFLDRQIVAILAEPIRNDLGLADWQIGMMTGLAFAVFYTFLGIPIARLAERKNRVTIISAAVGVWSAFTVMCGLAANFTQLLLARIGVGVGEAGCTPPAHSLISDYVPKEKRASALAFYSMGIPLGSLAGMAMGGMIADAWGWRAAFFVAGAPGILLAFITFFTLPEPRQSGRSPIERDPSAPTLMDAYRELRSKASFWWIAGGAAITAMVSYGHINFYGSFFLRNHGEGLAEISAGLQAATGIALGPIALVGLVLGLLIGIFGAAGTYFGGVMADRAARLDARGYALVPAIATIAAIPPFIAAFLVPSVTVSLAILVVPVFLGAIWYGPIFASAQTLVQPRTRATASAVLLFVINLIGLGLGPLSVGLTSTLLTPALGDAEAVRWAIIIFGAVSGLAALAFLMAARTLRQEVVS